MVLNDLYKNGAAPARAEGQKLASRWWKMVSSFTGCVVLALVNNPKVLILDEPTAGLDVQSRAQLHDEIRKIKAQGVTVLWATHDMAEAEALCDRIAIVIKGKIAICGTPEQVTAAGNKETQILLRTSKNSLVPGKDINGATFFNEKEGYLEWRCHDVADSVFALKGRRWRNAFSN